MQKISEILFLSTPSARRATSPAPGMSCTPRNFYPRPPRGGRPEVDRQHRHREKISIHALREEGDRLHGRDRQEVHQFLSTPSARRATCVGCGRLARGAYFYPRPPRGGRLICKWPLDNRRQFLSTPSARRATDLIFEYLFLLEFLSTPSARRATRLRARACAFNKYFYPRPPRGGRHLIADHQVCPVAISIHALREEGDHQIHRQHPAAAYFYPRPPRGGRHASHPDAARHRAISIHALREEGDGTRTQDSPGDSDFYPRPPRGGRLDGISVQTITPGISIHALREEGDAQQTQKDTHAAKISIHALREEGDTSIVVPCSSSTAISIHALREEGDLRGAESRSP